MKEQEYPLETVDDSMRLYQQDHLYAEIPTYLVDVEMICTELSWNT